MLAKRPGRPKHVPTKKKREMVRALAKKYRGIKRCIALKAGMDQRILNEHYTSEIEAGISDWLCDVVVPKLDDAIERGEFQAIRLALQKYGEFDVSQKVEINSSTSFRPDIYADVMNEQSQSTG